MQKINDIYDLRAAYLKHHPDGHFFDPETLKFFGERLSGMRVLKKKSHITDISGDGHECYVVSTTQRSPVTGRQFRTYHYFDTKDFDQVILP